MVLNEFLEVKSSDKSVGTESYKSRGLYARKPIPSGTVILESITTPYKRVDNEYMKRYAFHNTIDGGVLVAETGGSLFNHSKLPSVAYKVFEGGDLGYIIRFVTIFDISQGEELFIDYGYKVEM